MEPEIRSHPPAGSCQRLGLQICHSGPAAGNLLVKVAVTGARGFIGRYVLAELAQRNVEIVAAVRKGSETTRSTDKNTRWVELDISSPPENCFTMLGEPDVLIHLAWSGLPNYRSLHHFETELPTQYSFLAGLIRQGLPSLVTVGTCFEYGMQSGPLAAEMETRPNNPYGFAKDVLRRKLQYLQTDHSFNLTWARLFYMYGDGQAGTSLFPLLKKAVDAGEKTFKMSGGEQLRDYLHVAEVARLLVDLTLDSENIGAINVCSGKPTSIQNLVRGWIRENDWNIELELGAYPYPDYEPMAFWGDKP